jgi:hypothetical protein
VWCVQSCSLLLMTFSTVPTTRDTLRAPRTMRGCSISLGTRGFAAGAAARGSANDSVQDDMLTINQSVHATPSGPRPGGRPAVP